MHPALWLVLGVIGFLGVQKVGAAGSGARDAAGVRCPTDLAPTAVKTSVGALERVVAETGLRSLRGDGTADLEGLQRPAAARFSQVPSPPFGRLAPSAVVDAGYEIRWWSSDQDHQAASVFVFRGSDDAERFVHVLASIRCREHAVSYRLSQPAGAQALTWTNPLGVREADVFFARGSRTYRLIDVPPPTYPQGRFPVDAAEMVAAPQLLACQLEQAGCRPPAQQATLSPAAYDALKLVVAGERAYQSLPDYMAAGILSRECTAISRFWDPEARLVYQGCQVDWHYLSDDVYARRCSGALACQHWAIATAAGDLQRMATLERETAEQLTSGACRAAWNLYATLNDERAQAAALYGRALAAHDRRGMTRARLLSRDAVRNVDPSAAVGSCAPRGASSRGLPQLM